MQASIAVSVVVASHARHLRLRWLLNALEEQTLDSRRWEVLVVHDYENATAERVIGRHPLREAGRLRDIAIAPGTGSPARQRNLGWREAAGELIAFVDDDCRPEPDWLAELLTVSRHEPGAVVQGATRPDPLERDILAAPHVRTMLIEPVGPYAQTCNIVYPRRVLEQLGGFDDMAITGEDVDLSLRAQALGVRIVAAREAVVNHAVESFSLPGILRQNFKWRHLAYLVKRHPELRTGFPLGIFWDLEHFWTTVAWLGFLGRTQSPWLLTLTAPYVARSALRRGRRAGQRATALAEIPGQAVRQVAEVVGLAAGSVRHRTLVL